MADNQPPEAGSSEAHGGQGGPSLVQPRGALVVLDGCDPFTVLSSEAMRGYPYLLAADGALDRLLGQGILPHAVVGDLDSVSEEGLQALRSGRGLVDHRAAQDSTDFEKALEHLCERGIEAADVVGHRGDRLDHLMATLHAALRFAQRMDLRLLDEVAEAWVLVRGSSRRVHGRTGQICSLIPLLPSRGVTLRGFRWPLQKAELMLGQAISCSNELCGGPAEVAIEEGALLLYLHHPRASR